uniref:ATP synthase F0 subunit 8 n=1 Tax=Cyamophila willieti TaxID=2604842 RepID=A0A8F2E5T2_9HEMI|nr:ATP synthase F0 subunit 8 [Cyamophila willieti]
MPQMAPMPWILLMMTTILILFSMSTIIFFSLKTPQIKLLKTLTSTFSIKW